MRVWGQTRAEPKPPAPDLDDELQRVLDAKPAPPPRSARVPGQIYDDLQPMDPAFEGEEVMSRWGTAVRYLDDTAREAHQLNVKNGRLVDADGNLFDTASAGDLFGEQGSAIFLWRNRCLTGPHLVVRF